MQEKDYTTIKRRFSRESIAALRSLQDPSEAISDVVEVCIRNHKIQTDLGRTLHFSQLAASALPEKIVSQVNSNLEKTNALTLTITTFHSQFIETELEKYRHRNEMERMPRWGWFVGQIILAYYFSKKENIDFYTSPDEGSEKTHLPLRSKLPDQAQSCDLRSRLLKIRDELDELLALLP